MTGDPAERVAARCTEVATRRRDLDAASVAAASTAIAVRVVEIVAALPPGAVGSYFATDGEVDPTPVTDALRDLGWTTWFPVPAPPSAAVRSGAMSFRRWDEDEAPPFGRYGIPTPPATADDLDPLALDVVLVPLVLFGPSGARAGRGGGHYDATFAELAGATRPARPVLVGLAHDFQRDDELVSRAHDVTLDVVVTPTGVHRR